MHGSSRNHQKKNALRKLAGAARRATARVRCERTQNHGQLMAWSPAVIKHIDHLAVISGERRAGGTAATPKRIQKYLWLNCSSMDQTVETESNVFAFMHFFTPTNPLRDLYSSLVFYFCSGDPAQIHKIRVEIVRIISGEDWFLQSAILNAILQSALETDSSTGYKYVV